MAYLGIKESELKGLYYFSSLAMGESIGEKIENSIFYMEGEKKKALKEFNLVEADIKDGRILMDKFRNTENEMAYIAIEDTPFAGVYCFKRRAVRDREAKNFPNAYLSMDKAEMLAKYNISESEIRDGGYLMSGEVKNYLKKKKATPPQPVVKEKVEKKTETNVTPDIIVEDKEVKVNPKTSVSNANLLRNMIDAVAGDCDVVEIKMSNGEKYRVALRTFFYAEPDCNFENCAYVDTTGNIAIKEKAIEAIIDSGVIAKVEPSKIKYGDGFVTIRNCDDEYSPDISHDKMGRVVINHYIDKIVLNVSQVVSVKGFEHYTEINMNKITPDKYKLVHTYLMEKYKK